MSAGDWKYSKGGALAGPVTEPELVALIRSGQLGRDDSVWSRELGMWQPVSLVSELLLGRAGAAPRAVGPAALPAAAVRGPAPAPVRPQGHGTIAAAPDVTSLAPGAFDGVELSVLPDAGAVVPPPASAPASSAAVSPRRGPPAGNGRAPGVAGADWKYSKGGQLGGPVTRERVAEMVHGGALADDDLVFHATLGAWQPVAAVRKLLPTVPAALPGPPAPAYPAARPCAAAAPGTAGFAEPIGLAPPALPRGAAPPPPSGVAPAHAARPRSGWPVPGMPPPHPAYGAAGVGDAAAIDPADIAAVFGDAPAAAGPAVPAPVTYGLAGPPQPPAPAAPPWLWIGIGSGAGVLVVVLAAVLLWPRADWERDNKEAILAANAEARALVARGDLDGGVQRYLDVLQKMHGRMIRDEELQAVAASADAEMKAAATAAERRKRGTAGGRSPAAATVSFPGAAAPPPPRVGGSPAAGLAPPPDVEVPAFAPPPPPR